MIGKKSSCSLRYASQASANGLREPGLCVGVICCAADTSAVTSRGSAVHLRLRQKGGEVCNAELVLARGSETWLEDLGDSLRKSGGVTLQRAC